MRIEYNGKHYIVGNKYVIALNGYRLRDSPEDTRNSTTKIRAKLVLKKYEDGEAYHDYYHYGFVFEYPRVWRGVRRIEHITLPDAIRGDV